jgi:hypothetical protein
MGSLSRTIRSLCQCACRLCTLLLDTAWFLRLCLRPRAALAAENLFLRTQLARYQERHAKPRRTTNTTRFSWFCLPSGLTGDQRWWWCNRRRSHGGSARRFAYLSDLVLLMLFLLTGRSHSFPICR